MPAILPGRSPSDLHPPGQARAAEPHPAGPPFPRIGTCYGAGLGDRTWEEGGAYWSKLRLIVGGCYDLHYDWDTRDWSKILARVEQNLARLPRSIGR